MCFNIVFLLFFSFFFRDTSLNVLQKTQTHTHTDSLIQTQIDTHIQTPLNNTAIAQLERERQRESLKEFCESLATTELRTQLEICPRAATPPPMNQAAVSPDSAATISSSSSSSNVPHPGVIGQSIAIKLGHSYAVRADLNYCE